MKEIPNYPQYRQDLGDGRIRIVTIIPYGNKRVTAACKEFKEGHEDNDKEVFFYSYSFMKTRKNETLSQLKQLAKDYYNVKEEQRIKKIKNMLKK